MKKKLYWEKSINYVRSQILRCWELTQVSLHQQTVCPQISISEVQIEKLNQKLISQKRNKNQMRNLYQRPINFARGYSCVKEGLKTFKQILKKSQKLNTTFPFCNSLLCTYSGTCTIKCISYWEQRTGRAVLDLMTANRGKHQKSLFK